MNSDKLKGVIAASVLRCCSFLPFSCLQILGKVFGQILYLVNSRSRQITEINLSHCLPSLSGSERDALAKQSLCHSMQAVLEVSALWSWPRSKVESLIRDVHGEALLQQALADKHGVILLAPHLGNWEVLNAFATARGNMTALYAPAKFPALDKLMYQGRTRLGSELVPTNSAGVKALLKALKRGEMVIVLPDQVPEGKGGVFAPFFSQPALTMTLLSSLARRTGAQVICCYARRREDGSGFDVYLSSAETGIENEDDVMAAEAVNHSVERCVMQCPAQYQWEYKRFREYLPGARSIYKKPRKAELI